MVENYIYLKLRMVIVMATIQIKQGTEGRLKVYFPYSPERVELIKTIPGRKWDLVEKVWHVPEGEETIKRIKEIFHNDRIISD